MDEKQHRPQGVPQTQRRHRQVYRAHEVPDEILAAIEAAKAPPESHEFDSEYDVGNDGKDQSSITQ